jgi:hypothetical protein
VLSAFDNSQPVINQVAEGARRLLDNAAPRNHRILTLNPKLCIGDWLVGAAQPGVKKFSPQRLRGCEG